MRHFFSGIGLLTVTLAVLFLVVRGIGAQAKNPVAEMFSETTNPNGQRQACLYGICPGVTSLDEAKAILNKRLTFDAAFATDHSLCWGGITEPYSVCLIVMDGQITLITSRFATYDKKGLPRADRISMQLGNLMALWGNPVLALESGCGDDGISVPIVFQNGVKASVTLVPYSMRYDQTTWLIDPLWSQTESLDIYSTGDPSPDEDFSGGSAWRGLRRDDNFTIQCGGGE